MYQEKFWNVCIFSIKGSLLSQILHHLIYTQLQTKFDSTEES